MNFTRDPIILSVITPKEGCKLVVRNSKGSGQEDFFVDALEVVSFEGAIFYRSLERPKSFLVPSSDYEVLELKETRMVLKTSVEEKPIKISGNPQEKRDKKRHKRRKPSSEPILNAEPTLKEEGGGKKDETAQVSSSVLKKLFPPPNTLIKEKLNRFKNEEFFEENILPGQVESEEAQAKKEETSSEKPQKEESSKPEEEPQKKDKEEKPKEDNKKESKEEPPKEDKPPEE